MLIDAADVDGNENIDDDDDRAVIKLSLYLWSLQYRTFDYAS